jgi:hypothetical protein
MEAELKASVLVTLLWMGNAWSQGICTVDPFKDLKGQLANLQDPLCLPSMKYSYTLNQDCSYRLVSEVEIPSPIEDVDDFMKSKIINPAVNLASANRAEVLAYGIAPSGPGTYNQVMQVKKKGMTTKIFSQCRLTGGTFACAVDATRTKFKGMFPLFVKNETTITCSNKAAGLKKCSFTTVGKAAGIPFVAGACELAAPGAAETFEQIYRLAHYITHGNVTNLNKVDQSILGFRNKAKGNPGNGKKVVSVSGKIN